LTAPDDSAGAEALLAKVQAEIAVIDLDPADPASVAAALQRMDAIIDQYLGSFSADPVIGPVIAPMKERYRRMILKRGGGGTG
jgi:hypothetical protein